MPRVTDSPGKEGDLLAIPIDDRRVGIGQIILGGTPLYLVVLAAAHDPKRLAEPEELLGGRRLLI